MPTKAIFLGGASLLVCGTVAPAQTTNALSPAGTAAPPAVSPGLLNEWLRRTTPVFNPWDLGGQIRVRGEHREDFATSGFSTTAVDFRKKGGNDNTYLLLREKLHVGYTPVDWGNVFVEARDSGSYWDERSPDPENDRFDLHQAFVALGNPKAFPLLAKIGRQELSYGDERLIGAFDWNNIGRVFDAAKVRWEQPTYWVDGFVGRVIIPDDRNFNIANDYDVFSGIYASTRTYVPGHEAQAYFLARNVGAESPEALGANLAPILRGVSPRDIYTAGIRLKSLPGGFGGWDYDLEMAGQFGNFQYAGATPGVVNGERLDHEAFAAHFAGGYTFTNAWATPRVGLEYNFATGDDDPGDGEHNTFENLFPTNHKFYGFMDFFSWQNLHNPRLSTAIKPTKKLVVTGDFHAFWLADTDDFLYQVNGLPRTTGGYGLNSEAGAFVGTEVDVIATYNFTSYLATQAGYGHFFPSDYVRDSLRAVGGATDADWVYAQVVFNF